MYLYIKCMYDLIKNIYQTLIQRTIYKMEAVKIQ
jgi:hypothetical protein